MGGASVDGCTFYEIGGNLPGSVAVATVNQYDPASDAWTPQASMPEGLYGIQPTAAGTKVYVVGGYPDVFFQPDSTRSTEQTSITRC